MTTNELVARSAPPYAGALLESLRGLGYVPETAIADLIDNSIAAKASQVDVQIHWDSEKSWLRITDDGVGMSDAELEAAMRLGVKDPRSARAADDLGRFGLGLKTASFSQARRLTVASKSKGNERACLHWDLDLIGADNNVPWPLFEGPAPGSEHLLSHLEAMAHGTTVLWETMDRLVTPGFTADDMLELIDRIEQHLAMTFHRLLEGPEPDLIIKLNGRAVEPWDPFLTGHIGKALEGTVCRLLDTVGVFAQAHVLPHHDMLKPAVAEAAAGPAGWIQQQGFYVYRNKRLLVAGGWLNLGDGGKPWVNDDQHRLARLRVDIPNSADAEWKIDVLKSTASPPVHLRRQLHMLASEARAKARAVLAHRAFVAPANAGSLNNPQPDVWQAIQRPDGISYRLDRKHPLIRSLLESVGKDGAADVSKLLELIETTVPVQRIWIDEPDPMS